MKKLNVLLAFAALFCFFLASQAQLSQSGGAGSTMSATQSGTWTVQPGNTANTTPWLATVAQGGNSATVSAGGALKVDGSAVTQPVSGSVTATLGGGVANLGFVRMLPSSCTQSTNFTSTTVGVATGGGTSITSTTTCATFAFVNNITNSPVTLRIQDKTGTPIVWLGGNADFSIPANSNFRIPIDGVIFTGGATAIAGTGAALNLQFNGVQ